MHEQFEHSIFDSDAGSELAAQTLEYIRLFQELDPEAGTAALNMAGLLIEAVLNGHVCLPADTDRIRKSFDTKLLQSVNDETLDHMINSLLRSNIVGASADKPLVMEDDRLYIQKYWHYENFIASWFRHKVQKETYAENDEIQLLRNFLQTNDYNERQKLAIAVSAFKDLIIVTGGPGTGKTHTVRGILQLLMESETGPMNIALCAPTGKAAQKLAESMQDGISEHANVGKIVSQTIHKLLGADRFGTRFRFGESLKVPYDVIILDEASMLDIRMWFHVLKALKEDAKLIILGDKDQLASVEAGSLLGDICSNRESFSAEFSEQVQKIGLASVPVSKDAIHLNDHVVYLNKTYRYSRSGGIGALADNIKSGESDKVVQQLMKAEGRELRYLPAKKELLDPVIHEFGFDQYKNDLSAKEYFEISKQKRILGSTRHGFFGITRINNAIERSIRSQYGFPDSQDWYNGRMILSSRNDDLIGVRNGEIGISYHMDKDYTIEFEGTPGVRIPAQRLRSYEPAYAMTIHKSQGSEFGHVAVILSPEIKQGHLSRELLYTAVTRARESVLVMGDPKNIAAAIDNPVKRNSGLHLKLHE